MARKAIPKYRRLKRPKGADTAFVEIQGHRTYLGAYGSGESYERYRRLLAELEASGGQRPVASSTLTVVEVLAAYWHHVASYYVKDGKPTGEVKSVRQALRPLTRLYGRLPAADFSPLKLRAVRQAYIKGSVCRSTVNRHTQRIKQAFKWAVENEYIPPAVHYGLQSVIGLRKGRTDVRESIPVGPVPDEFVDAIRPYVSRQVWAIVELQRLTGMRSGEVVIMRGRDLDTSGPIWLYRPESHKTQHHGHERIVEIGPKVQAVIRPFLKPDLEVPLFSPADADAERRAEMHAQRKTPMSCGNRPGTNRKREPKRMPGDRYDRDSYRRAVTRACKLAGVPAWHPHQLRHNYGTRIRREYGIECARILLGHKSVPMAELYSEIDRGKAREIVSRIG